MNELKISILRAQALEIYQELRAILILTRNYHERDERDFGAIQQWASIAGVAELRGAIRVGCSTVARLRREYGITATGRHLIEIAQLLEASPERTAYIPKPSLREMVKNYGRALPVFDGMPEHVRIALTARPFASPPQAYEWRAVESTLYEDMCALFNLAHDVHVQKLAHGRPKSVIKRSYALNRATVTASFYFVESYLNGVAFDQLVTESESLSDKQKDLLAEFDFDNGRIKFVTFRDKAVKYTQIASKQPFPPIDENNCPELKFLVETAKELRDAIVHASPLPDWQMRDYRKEDRLYAVEFEVVEEVVDNAIRLVRRIENTIRGHGRLLYWVSDRGPDGLFPEHVFD